MSIGYACNIQGNHGYNLKACNLKNATLENLQLLTEQNLQILDKMIDYNLDNRIKLFRISSDIIPFGSHPINNIPWWVDHKDFLLQIGLKIKNSGIRVSMHPGQYTVINSPDIGVVQRAFEDLKYHGKFLDSLDVDYKNKIILHIGGVYGDKTASLERFRQNFKLLPENIKNRLVIENDEKCYNIEDVLYIGNSVGLPVVFDVLHHKINHKSENHSYIYWIEQCSKTWKEKDGKQKIHYSQQNPLGKSGSHSQSISIATFLEFYKTIKKHDVDIMLEVKDKNISALKCILSTIEPPNFTCLEKEWARYKYLILSHSHNIYQQLRDMIKDRSALTVKDFYEKIEEGLNVNPNKGSQTNAALHIWGYFRNLANDKEITKFNKLMVSFNNGSIEITTVKNHLLKLAINYKISYLVDSYYFLKS